MAKLSIPMPDMGENIQQGLILRIMVAIGDTVTVDDPLVEIEAEKTVLEVPAPHGGMVEEILVEEGMMITAGEPLLVITEETAAVTTGNNSEQQLPTSQPQAEMIADATDGTAKKTPPATVATTDISEQKPSNAYAGPSARRLCRDLGVDIEQVPGTGGQGRITVDDIKAYVRNNRSPKTSAAQPELPDFRKLTEIIRESPSGLKKTVSRNMANAWSRIPHAWVEVKVDVTQLEQLRKQYWSGQNGQPKINLTVYLLKILGQTLKEFPQFNACYEEESGDLLLKAGIHLGLAVDSARGLLVPVIKEVDTLSLEELAQKIEAVVTAARTGKIEPDLLSGSGMTVSNLGGMGVDRLFPIVNWPEVAILGVGAATLEPVWEQDRFVPRSMLSLVLGFDHRVINGADAARFLGRLQELIEMPFLLALG